MVKNTPEQDLVTGLFFHLNNAFNTETNSDFSVGYRSAAIEAAKAVLEQLKEKGVNVVKVLRTAEEAAINAL
jgi:hypothetical protein